MKDADNKPAAPTPRSGEVRHDERGHAVWHWAADTARNAVNSTSQLLRKLDLSHLSLQDADTKKLKQTAKTEAAAAGKPQVKSGSQPAAATRRAAGGGFDPYAGSGPAARAKTSAQTKKPSPASSARRSSWWQRLFRRD